MGDTTCSIILFANEFLHHSISNLLVYSVHVCVCVCVCECAHAHTRVYVCMCLLKSIYFLQYGGR